MAYGGSVRRTLEELHMLHVNTILLIRSGYGHAKKTLASVRKKACYYTIFE